MKKITTWFHNLIKAFHYRYATLMLDYAIHRAEKAHRASGERYYVIPDSGRKLIVINRKEFRGFRRVYLLDPSKRIADLMKTSFYFTADRAEKQILRHVDIQAKREMYLKWYFAKDSRK